MIVVPCYNEAARLNTAAWDEFAVAEPAVSFLFVNDGSIDETRSVLQRLCTRNPQQFCLCDLPQNRGKAEAVRQGMLLALERRPDYVGYWDADLATPLKTILEFVEVLDARPDIELVMGSRVRLLGHDIQRSAVRHALGRIFATAAAWTLQLPVYDTQCGAKLFRVSPGVESTFARSFRTNWTFDVEVLARMVRDAEEANGPAACHFFEFPLSEWRDVPGSKVRPWEFVRALAGLIVIAGCRCRPTPRCFAKGRSRPDASATARRG